MRLLPLFFLLGSAPALAGAEDAILARLRDQYQYRCTDNAAMDGYVCTAGITTVLIPKGLAKHEVSVLYGHGFTHRCGPGASGENYLKDQMPTLKRANAVAFFPYRDDFSPDHMDFDFPFQSYIALADKILGDHMPWMMAAHSAGGKWILRMLADSPSVTVRVREILFLDAAYDVDELMLPPLNQVMEQNPKIKLKAISTTTLTKNNHLRDEINKSYPGAMDPVRSESGEHCDAPKYFNAL